MSLGNSILNAVEKAGNKLPDPVTIFVILIGVVMLASLVMSSLGASVEHPVTGETIEVVNLLTGAQLQTLLVNMPAVLTGFAPLGMVLVVMIGAGIAEKTGLLAAGLPVGPMRNTEEVMTHPHTIHRGMAAEKDGWKGWGIPIKFSRTPGEIKRRPPRFGEHGRELLEEKEKME